MRPKLPCHTASFMSNRMCERGNGTRTVRHLFGLNPDVDNQRIMDVLESRSDWAECRGFPGIDHDPATETGLL